MATHLKQLQNSKDFFEKNLTLYYSYNFVQSKNNISKTSTSYFFASSTTTTNSSSSLASNLLPSLQSHSFLDPYLAYHKLYTSFNSYMISLGHYRKLLIESLFDWNNYEALLSQEFLSIYQEMFLLKSKHNIPEQVRLPKLS